MPGSTDMFRLDGKLATIIGGSSGIGRQIALAFQGAGAGVTVVGRDQDKLDTVARELGALVDGKPRAYSADMRDVAAIG